MIACLVGNSARLAELARQFSPVVEQASAGEIVFSIDGLGSLFGDIYQIAAEISRRGAQMEIHANLAIAVNKTTAQLAARHYRGVTIIEAGKEAKILAELPVQALPAPPDIIETLMRWGIRTVGNLAALPETGVRERLGESGSRLRRVALGRDGDVISIRRETQEYVVKRELDDGIEQLEHLLFVISAQLHELTERLSHDGRAACAMLLTLTLDREAEFIRSIEFPLATRDPLAILKQLQLSLDADPPRAGILAVQTELKPTSTRVVQSGLFHAAAPEPDKLQTLLARLTALVGSENVGSPEILDSHHPDPVRLRPCAFEPAEALHSERRGLHIAFRWFRPPLGAHVVVKNHAPAHVRSDAITGPIKQAAGPWRTSGGIWTASRWDRDEWDILLESRTVYRIYSTPEKHWFLCGSYD